VASSSLVEGLSLKVRGIKCPQTSDDSLFASGTIPYAVGSLAATPPASLPLPIIPSNMGLVMKN